MKRRILIATIFAIAAAWLPGFADGGERIAYVLFGGNAAQDKAPALNGVGDFEGWSRLAGPVFKKHGITEVYLQNPGGLYPEFLDKGETDMRCNQWLLAEERGHAFANREQLRTAFENLARFGVKKVYVYLGSPTQLEDPERELPECAAPFIDAAKGVVKVAFMFDALFFEIKGGKAVWRPEQWEPGKPLPRALFVLRHKGCEVYAEPRLEPDQIKAGMGYLIDGTVAAADYDKHHKVDFTVQPGKTIRISDPRRKWDEFPEVKKWPANITPALRSDFNWGPATPEPK